MPSLLPGEELVCPGLRVYLISDCRDEYCGGVGGGRVLLPAEGAIFLTNYHLIFKGSPLDPFSSENSVCRAFPITSLIKEKLFSMNEYISEIDQVLKNGIQLRSSTFQLIRAVFDDEVTAEEIANLCSLIHHTQFPQTWQGQEEQVLHPQGPGWVDNQECCQAGLNQVKQEKGGQVPWNGDDSYVWQAQCYWIGGAQGRGE